MMPTFDDAVSLAVRVHTGQVDRAGHPYMLHVLRVTSRVFDATAQLVAVLHDVVEDTPVTLDELRLMGYPEEMVEAIDCLTRRDGERYEDMIERIARNPLAVRVKLSDLQDHMDLRRGTEITPDDLERIARYQKAYRRLTTGT
jgi:(p)ppGpp synthase/HD superfamily hydrolase